MALADFLNRRNHKHISSMIQARKNLNLEYSETIGFEGTDQALILAQIKVYEAMLSLNCPTWAIKGDKHFRKYLKKYGLKVPTYDFNFIEENVPKFWDAFRFTMLDPSNPGNFTSKAVSELILEFEKCFKEMPKKFRASSEIELQAIELAIEALKLCLYSDNQLLANPVFEVILLIWYHYKFPIV